MVEDRGVVEKLDSTSRHNSGSLLEMTSESSLLAGMTGYTLEEIEEYTNTDLTIADFIVPALAT